MLAASSLVSLTATLGDAVLALGMAPPAQNGQPVNPLVNFMPFVFILIIFYFLLIRPQQKKMDEHKSMLDALEKGDEVVLSSGLCGKIHGITDDYVTLEIAANTRVKVARNRIEGKLEG